MCALGLLLWLMLSAAAPAGGAGFSSYAIVEDDGILRIDGRRVRLYGIYIPETEQSCQRFRRPARCGSRAALALDFKIRGFVHCTPVRTNKDRTVTAQCVVGKTAFSEGLDLSAYLIERGWALARPHAPFEYHALERIARSRGMGVWGFSDDTLHPLIVH